MNLFTILVIFLTAIEPRLIGIVRGAIAAIARPRGAIAFIEFNSWYTIFVGTSPNFLILSSVFVNLRITPIMVPTAIEPSVIGIVRGAIAAIPRPRGIIDPAIFKMFFIFKFLDAFDNLFSAIP